MPVSPAHRTQMQEDGDKFETTKIYIYTHTHTKLNDESGLASVTFDMPVR